MSLSQLEHRETSCRQNEWPIILSVTEPGPESPCKDSQISCYQAVTSFPGLCDPSKTMILGDLVASTFQHSIVTAIHFSLMCSGLIFQSSDSWTMLLLPLPYLKASLLPSLLSSTDSASKCKRNWSKVRLGSIFDGYTHSLICCYNKFEETGWLDKFIT